MRAHLRKLAMAALAFATLGGCAGAYYYDPYVYDTYYWYGYDSSMYYTYYDPYYPYYYKGSNLPQDSMVVTPEVLAARTAMGAAAYYEPSGCVNATSAGATATIVLTDCDKGPFGFRDISGTLTATFQIDAATAAISVNTSSSGLQVNGHTAAFTGTGTSTSTETGRTFTGTSTGAVEGNFGNQLSRTSQIRIDWVPGSGCFTINSSGMLEGDGTQFTSQLQDLEKCRGQCPSAGTLTLTGPERVVTVSFDGTDHPGMTATDTSERGTLDLTCEAP